MLILTILHILAMFVAFAFTTGVGILAVAVANSGDVRTIRVMTRVVTPFLRAGTWILLAGVIFGFGTASAEGYALGSKWLITAYVLVILIFGIGAGVHQAWLRRLASAAAASPEDQRSAELVAVTQDRTARIAGPISGLLWIAVIVVMVLKPW